MATEEFAKEACPICSSKQLSIDMTFSDFDVICCGSCDNRWRSNMYDRAKIMEIYLNDDYARHSYFESSQEEAGELSKQRYKDYSKGLKRIESFRSENALLDVGCGAGHFITVAKNHGWITQGVELSNELAMRCEASTGSRIIQSTFEEAAIPEQSLDVITFWDIIEHVIDPMKCLKKAHDSIRGGGAVLFCTPDDASILARIGKLVYQMGYKYPALALHPPNHTYFFTRPGFRKMLEDSGFHIAHEYSQMAYFEHSPLASSIQKIGIRAIEGFGKIFDRQYEQVMIAVKG